MKRLGEIWDLLPDVEHTRKYIEPTTNLRIYEVVGKKFTETTSINIVLECLTQFFGKYGQRAKQAEQNQGVDWKAMSHALRAGYQLEQMYKEGNITFPLRRADWLKQIKAGEIPFQRVADELEEQLDYVKTLAKYSDYPEQVDRRWVDEWLVSIIEKII